MKLYWEIAVPLAAVTIVFPVIGPRMLRWMIFAPRTNIRLLLVLFVDWIALAMFILVLQISYGTFSDVANSCLGFSVVAWYGIFPWARASGVLVKEVKAFKRSRDHSLKAAFRVFHEHFLKHNLFSGFLFFLIYFVVLPLSIGSSAFYYVSIALFFTYRFFSSWRVYQRLARS